jgi:hypothetical protein
MTVISATFLKSTRLDRLGDYAEFAYDFSTVEAHLVGAPEEKAATRPSRVTVKLTRSLQSMWRLSDQDAERVSYEFARRDLQEHIAEGSDTGDIALELHSSTQPRDCPYDPNRIIMYLGDSFEVEVHRPLGFRRT